MFYYALYRVAYHIMRTEAVASVSSDTPVNECQIPCERFKARPASYIVRLTRLPPSSAFSQAHRQSNASHDEIEETRKRQMRSYWGVETKISLWELLAQLRLIVRQSFVETCLVDTNSVTHSSSAS